MNLSLTRNMMLDTETGRVQKTSEKISIEFWDPRNPLNKGILENAEKYTFRQLAILFKFSKSIGRTGEPIIRRG